MRNLYKRRLRVLLLYSDLFIISILGVVIIYGYWLIPLVIIATILLSIRVAIIWTNVHKNSLTKILKNEHISHRRLELLREIIDLSYTHECNTDLFHKKVREIVCVDRLKDISVIDFERNERHLSKKASKLLSIHEREFYCFIKAGFTPRELSVIYNLSNPKSIYVKKHRIMAKINKSSHK